MTGRGRSRPINEALRNASLTLRKARSIPRRRCSPCPRLQSGKLLHRRRGSNHPTGRNGSGSRFSCQVTRSGSEAPLGIMARPELGPGQPETRVKLLTSGFVSYYEGAFQRLALDRAANERNALNLSASGLWQGPGRKGNRMTALQDLIRRRRDHKLAAIDATEAPLMNAAIADFLRDFTHRGTDRTLGCAGVDWSDLSQVDICAVLRTTSPIVARPGFAAITVCEQYRRSQFSGSSTRQITCFGDALYGIP